MLAQTKQVVLFRKHANTQVFRRNEETKMSNIEPSEGVKDGVEGHVAVVATGIGSAAIDGDPITIGEALEAAGISVGDKAVDQNDADAVSAAEIRATGEQSVRSGGVGESAQTAATLNSHVMRAQDMTKLSDILMVKSPF